MSRTIRETAIRETMMKMVHFASRQDFRKWLAANHAESTELLVSFYKKHTGKSGATYDEAVEEALCYGWIDGVKRRVDNERFTHRFSPRKAKSTWSRINVQRALRLIEAGQMAAPGLRAFESRQEKRTGVYTYEQKRPGLSAADKKRFMRHAKAWEFFAKQPPGYQRLAGFWVSRAKREETRLRRLARLIDVSLKGRRLDASAPTRAASPTETTRRRK
jgi:uncharacterized protein YdeI (YjbR/CyaY-like superfamily)